MTSFVTTYCPQSSFNKADLNQVLALPHFDLFFLYIFLPSSGLNRFDSVRGIYETRGRKRTQEEMLALYSRQTGTDEGESNFLRTFQKSQASAPNTQLYIYIFFNILLAPKISDPHLIQARHWCWTNEKTLPREDVKIRAQSSTLSLQFEGWQTKCRGISPCCCLLACCPHSCWLQEKLGVQSRKQCWGRFPAWRHSWQNVCWNALGWRTSKSCSFRTTTTYGWKIPRKVRSHSVAVFKSGILQKSSALSSLTFEQYFIWICTYA